MGVSFDDLNTELKKFRPPPPAPQKLMTRCDYCDQVIQDEKKCPNCGAPIIQGRSKEVVIWDDLSFSKPPPTPRPSSGNIISMARRNGFRPYKDPESGLLVLFS